VTLAIQFMPYLLQKTLRIIWVSNLLTLSELT